MDEGDGAGEAGHHDHTGTQERRYLLPGDFCDPDGWPADRQLTARLYDAVLDRCAPCRQELLDRAADDPATVTSLVNWSLHITAETYGGIPAPMLRTGGPLPGPFRDLLGVCLGAPYDEEYPAVRTTAAAAGAQERQARQAPRSTWSPPTPAAPC